MSRDRYIFVVEKLPSGHLLMCGSREKRIIKKKATAIGIIVYG